MPILDSLVLKKSEKFPTPVTTIHVVGLDTKPVPLLKQKSN